MRNIFARAGALVMAMLFLVTSLALTIAVIWQSTHHKDNQMTDQTSQTTPNQLKGTKLVGFTPLATVTKLEKIDHTTGQGAEVKASDTVTVDYTGAVAATGIIFESSKDSGQKATFGLNQVIKGWAEGLPGMKVGGTRRLVIPADLAYADNPPPGSGIPANAPLVFDVTLIKIGK